jgi:hypothetical protein
VLEKHVFGLGLYTQIHTDKSTEASNRVVLAQIYCIIPKIETKLTYFSSMSVCDFLWYYVLSYTRVSRSVCVHFPRLKKERTHTHIHTYAHAHTIERSTHTHLLLLWICASYLAKMCDLQDKMSEKIEATSNEWDRDSGGDVQKKLEGFNLGSL